MATATKFQLAQAAVNAGTLNAPHVTFEGKEVDYFTYQISVHHFNLKLMAKGMSFRGVKLNEIKKYYGLKGRTAADCLPQFVTVVNEYRASKGRDPLPESK